MLQIRLFYLVLVFSFFIGCTTSKPAGSGVQSIEVTDIQKFETFSYIQLIEEKNTGKLNDSISDKSRQVFHETLTTFNRIPITGHISSADTMIHRRIEREVEYMVVSASRQRNLPGLKLTPVLDSLLDAQGKRFGLITVTTGFTRAKGNLGGQVAKGVAVGILTLGMYAPSPIKANSTVYAMIVDAKENNVAFYKNSIVNKEPLDKAVLTKQIQRLFESYFGTSK